MKSPGLRLYSSRKNVWQLKIAQIRLSCCSCGFLFFAAVDGEVRVHRHDAVVVFGARLREHFLGFVAFLSWRVCRKDHGRLISEHGDVVFVRAAIGFAVDADELDVVARVAVDG